MNIASLASPARLLLRLRADPLRVRFLSNAIWSVLGATLSRALPIVASVFAARWLGVAAFGELGVIQNTVTLFTVVAGLGLGVTATKFVAEHRATSLKRAGEFAALALVIGAAAGLMTAVVFAAIAPWLADKVFAAPEIVYELRLATGLLFLGALNGAQLGVLKGLEAFRASASIGAIEGVSAAVLLVVGVAVAGLPGGIVAWVGGEAVSAFLYWWLIRREARKLGMPIRCGPWRDQIPVLFRFSAPAMLAAMATVPAMWAANVFLVNRPGGYVDMGMFAAASRWYFGLLFVPTAVAGIVLPMLANLHASGDPGGFRSVFRANLVVSLVFTAVPAGVLVAFAAPIMSLYGPAYTSGWPILAILAVGTIPTALNTVLGQVIVSVGAIGWRLAFDLILAAVLVGVAWLLIPILGASGLAWAYVGAFTAASVGLAIFLRSRPPAPSAGPTPDPVAAIGTSSVGGVG